MRKAVFLVSAIFLSSVFLFSADFTNPEGWFAYDDSAAPNNGSSKISIEPVTNGEILSVSAKGSVTKKFQYGFAGFGINPSPAELANIKKAKGFKFKVKGDGRAYRVRAHTSNIRDYNYFGKIFITKPGQIIEVKVLYSELEQEAWGSKVVFNVNKINQITFQTTEQPIASFALTIIGFELIM
ncbi:MAG: CIA30 family protein [Spirochaetes bacterium]|nr:CIA30 family protein [Spirochaetota bacterium]